MSIEEFEAEIRRHIATLEADRDEVARRIDEDKVELKNKEALLANWHAALVDYQRKNGLPVTIDYSTLRPRERADLWASKNDGVVVIKDLANVLVEAGRQRTTNQPTPRFAGRYSDVTTSDRLSRASTKGSTQSNCAPGISMSAEKSV